MHFLRLSQKSYLEKRTNGKLKLALESSVTDINSGHTKSAALLLPLAVQNPKGKKLADVVHGSEIM